MMFLKRWFIIYTKLINILADVILTGAVQWVLGADSPGIK
jgi:hypothetical protein